jgi:hypothetical protein
MKVELDKKKVDAAMEFALQTIKQLPRGDREALEAHMNAVLIVFWGALWGTFGTEYAQGFIEAQLRGMETDQPHEKYTEPTVQ